MTTGEFTGATIGPELQTWFWNRVFGWLPMYPEVTEPAAAPRSAVLVAAVGGISIVVLLLGQYGKRKNSIENEEAGGADTNTESVNEETDGEVGLFENIDEIQQTVVGPNTYEDDTRAPKLGDEDRVQVLYVDTMNAYPTIPIDGYLEEVMETTDVEFDLLCYFDHLDFDRTKARFKSNVATAAADASTSSIADIETNSERLARLQEMYKEMDNHQRQPFRISTYVGVRGRSKKEVQKARRKMKEVFSREPADQELSIAVGQQKEGIQSLSPIGKDVLGETDPQRYKATMLSGAFGAAYASIVEPTEIHPNGIEYGWHKSSDLPLILDPWAHDRGNAMVMIADPGGGKSTTGKALMQRVLDQREDVIGVAIEPMGNWAGVAQKYESTSENPGKYEGAEHITVGGNRGINPLQIREVPPEKRHELADDADPLGQRKELAISILENIFKMRGKERQFSEHRVVLENAISDVYREWGIYHDDLDSHARESPTLRDLRHGPIKDRFENPSNYSEEGMQDDQIKRAAQWLYHEFGMFDVRDTSNDTANTPDDKDTESHSDGVRGAYANFGEQTDFDIFGNKFVYLDLGQSEGSVSEKAQLTMQILLDQVYEMAKQTDKKVVLSMDEFRYFIRDVANIESVENIFRHHRHQDIAPWIMTQTVHEFLQREESKSILDMCPYFLGQKYEKMEESDAKKLKLTREQYEFVTQEAKPGTPDRGYADALLKSGDRGRKIKIKLTEPEFAVSEWDAGDPPEALPGIGTTVHNDTLGRGMETGEDTEATTQNTSEKSEQDTEGYNWSDENTTEQETGTVEADTVESTPTPTVESETTKSPPEPTPPQQSTPSESNVDDSAQTHTEESPSIDDEGDSEAEASGKVGGAVNALLGLTNRGDQNDEGKDQETSEDKNESEEIGESPSAETEPAEFAVGQSIDDMSTPEEEATEAKPSQDSEETEIEETTTEDSGDESSSTLSKTVGAVIGAATTITSKDKEIKSPVENTHDQSDNGRDADSQQPITDNVVPPTPSQDTSTEQTIEGEIKQENTPEESEGAPPEEDATSRDTDQEDRDESLSVDPEPFNASPDLENTSTDPNGNKRPGAGEQTQNVDGESSTQAVIESSTEEEPGGDERSTGEVEPAPEIEVSDAKKTESTNPAPVQGQEATEKNTQQETDGKETMIADTDQQDTANQEEPDEPESETNETTPPDLTPPSHFRDEDDAGDGFTENGDKTTTVTSDTDATQQQQRQQDSSPDLTPPSHWDTNEGSEDGGEGVSMEAESDPTHENKTTSTESSEPDLTPPSCYQENTEAEQETTAEDAKQETGGEPESIQTPPVERPDRTGSHSATGEQRAASEPTQQEPAQTKTPADDFVDLSKSEEKTTEDDESDISFLLDSESEQREREDATPVNSEPNGDESNNLSVLLDDTAEDNKPEQMPDGGEISDK